MNNKKDPLKKEILEICYKGKFTLRKKWDISNESVLFVSFQQRECTNLT
jgi:hypothetical protein